MRRKKFVGTPRGKKESETEKKEMKIGKNKNLREGKERGTR